MDYFVVFVLGMVASFGRTSVYRILFPTNQLALSVLDTYRIHSKNASLV